MDLKELLKKFFVVSPILYQLIPVILYFATKQREFLYFAFIILVFGFGLNKTLKFGLKRVVSDNEVYKRPNVPPEGCGVYPRNDYHQDFGMPSGHTQIAFITAVFWSMYLNDKMQDKKKAKLISIGLFVLAALVGYSRIKIGCHNIQQVIAGSVIGIVVGFVAYRYGSKL
jgi:membrane-associated phospholipid phosphatase